ncbi:uncharacterized protein [Littorina saxatilis]|uniref:uncharacterized protein isoform X2 n=1 Tax=Littorina saxatilis TaxID=31220 RepID=UPI0038B6A3BC
MSVVKSGYLRKHSKSILHGGWNRVWVILYKDSNLVVFKKQGDSSPMGTINMVEVKKWFAYGDHTNGMPDRPQPPAGCSINQIIGIPEKPSSKAKVHWFLADNDAELHAWMEAICSTLPPPPEKQAPAPSAPASVSSSDMIQAQHSKPVSSGPPYPGGPAPSLGFDGVAGPPMPSPTYQHHTHSGYRQPGQHPQQGPYPQAPPQQGYYGPPTPAAYPQQPQGAYPQQPGYPQAPPHYAPPPGSYPQQPYYAPPPGGHYPQQQGYQQQQGYHQGYPQQPTTVVYQNAPQKKGGFMNSTGGKIAMGAALGYGASQLMGGGMYGGGMYGGGMYGGGFGWGHGSWSSLSSFGSCGSFGSWD